VQNPVLRRQRQEDGEFEASLGYKKKKKNQANKQKEPY
jgi:hypothetical protein